MKKLFDEFSESIYLYDFRKAAENGIKAVILDIDNTLVPNDAPSCDRSDRLIKHIRELGMFPVVISNNSEKRVESFCKSTNTVFYFKAGKPFFRTYFQFLRKYGLKKEEVLAVGDQIFTDMIGAAGAGIRTVLVKPIDFESDSLGVKIKRLFEKPFIPY